MPLHTDRQYEEELSQLKEHILKMGSVVEAMIDTSARALVERNTALADEVIRQEPDVNQLELDIDNLCLRLIALRQPAASDLRFIAISLKISTDLERMGDLSVNIAQRSIELSKSPPLKDYVDLPKMARIVQKMVRDALDAFLKRDPERAHTICITDDEVDHMYKQVYKDVIGRMETDSSTVSRGVSLISVTRHLERIADHATNIAESVIYMVKGKDIRHGALKG